VLILGEPDRDQLYDAVGAAERRLGRPVQATIREAGWLDSGSGSFHQTVTSRPLLEVIVVNHGRQLREALGMLAGAALPDQAFADDMEAVLAEAGPTPDDP
jgi:hypothetical protein